MLALHYRTVLRLGYPAAEVGPTRLAEARRERLASADLPTPTFGLVGAGGGVLPRHYTALVGAEQRKRSDALHGFFDLSGSRFTGLFVKAGDNTARPATRNRRSAPWRR